MKRAGATDGPIDYDIDDEADDVVFDDDYSGTVITLNADHSDETTDDWDKSGNMLRDGTHKYTYDAWNRLVKVETDGGADRVTLATYAYDALGRRIKKVVTNSGDLDGTEYFYYNDRWQLLESRNAERDQGGSVKGPSSPARSSARSTWTRWSAGRGTARREGVDDHDPACNDSEGCDNNACPVLVHPMRPK